MTGADAGTFRLTLLRHGHAAPPVAGDDHGRPLDARGRLEIAVRAPELLQLAGRPGVCVASDALRTRQTAALLCSAAGFEGLQPRHEAGLYLAAPDEILGVLRGLAGPPTHHLLVVGHNPGLSELGTRLRARAGDHPAAIGLGTGQFTSVCFPAGDWAALLAAAGG